MHIYIGCICLTFLHCDFFHFFGGFLPESFWISSWNFSPLCERVAGARVSPNDNPLRTGGTPPSRRPLNAAQPFQSLQRIREIRFTKSEKYSLQNQRNLVYRIWEISWPMIHLSRARGDMFSNCSATPFSITGLLQFASLSIWHMTYIWCCAIFTNCLQKERRWQKISVVLLIEIQSKSLIQVKRPAAWK